MAFLDGIKVISLEQAVAAPADVGGGLDLVGGGRSSRGKLPKPLVPGQPLPAFVSLSILESAKSSKAF